ncbi:radical SAM protein [Adlercreutzia sp. R21]|uniref:radical SAM protein n=1 Tax=Adlercreutzia wanghongyangiae TaxID=3111451 RepID=UPI002DB75F33|nr:radical SAM protein [Adlercreutzia sp. R21]MEC4183866.1 radical SAM protein [Adlercreutzia sp. R21]
MHYTGTIWRPPYEADSLIIEATAGCTHHRCKFCTLYEDLPFKFRPSPLEDIEADLLEAQTWYHDPLRKAEERLFALPGARTSRIFLAGANPFGLKARHLLRIAELVRGYFPQCESVGCFSRITDVAAKTDGELADLAAVGFDGLTIGVETGDEVALAFMDKGYGAEDIVEQCARLDAAGISYAFFYLAGISGAGRGIEGARATAAICNRTSPWLIGANMLTVYRNSALHAEIAAGRWREAREVEKYEEVKELISRLSVPVEFAMLGASNPVMLRGRLPEQREEVIAALDAVISDIGEDRLRSYRANLRHL